MNKIESFIVSIKGITVLIGFLFIFSSCSKDTGGGDVGKGGSLNKFTIIGSFLYVIDNEKIETYSIDKGNMNFISSTVIEPGIETLYPFDSLVLVGAQNGMHICRKELDGSLVLISGYRHIQTCDPVVTDGQTAYVTLSAGCGENADQLDILNLVDPYNPVLIKSYPMHHPKGLGIDDQLLFICDSDQGLKIFDRSDHLNLKQLYHFSHFYALDVIPYHGLLIVLTDKGFRQFDYTNAADIKELSTFIYN